MRDDSRIIFSMSKPTWECGQFQPLISETTMLVHLGLHAKYVQNLNDMLVKYPELAAISATDALRNPSAYFSNEEDKMKYVNNMGGHFCHSLFWFCIDPNPQQRTQENFFKKTKTTRAQLEKKLKANGLSRFGAGWSWLALGQGQELKDYSTQNHFTPFMKLQTPILCVDVWEHAYFLDRFGNRSEWLDIILGQIDWNKVNYIYEQVSLGKMHPIEKLLTTRIKS